ncbi:hypothetical protein Bbelb_264600 [Branchiostoma belcheri]|nr:hypothetical protein Bbelb_264600 [Branchiostoma belcheri]
MRALRGSRAATRRCGDRSPAPGTAARSDSNRPAELSYRSRKHCLSGPGRVVKTTGYSLQVGPRNLTLLKLRCRQVASIKQLKQRSGTEEVSKERVYSDDHTTWFASFVLISEDALKFFPSPTSCLSGSVFTPVNTVHLTQTEPTGEVDIAMHGSSFKCHHSSVLSLRKGHDAGLENPGTVVDGLSTTGY